MDSPGLALYSSKTKRTSSWLNIEKNPPSYDELVEWMRDNCDPFIPDFDQSASTKVFFEHKDAVIYFSDRNDRKLNYRIDELIKDHISNDVLFY